MEEMREKALLSPMGGMRILDVDVLSRLLSSVTMVGCTWLCM
jgi:hypothetical protein